MSNLELDSNGSRLLVLTNDKTLRVFEIGTSLDGKDPASLLARSTDDIEALLAQRVRKPTGSLFFDDQNAILRLTRKFEQQIERKPWGAASFTGGNKLDDLWAGIVSGWDYTCALHVMSVGGKGRGTFIREEIHTQT